MIPHRDARAASLYMCIYIHIYNNFSYFVMQLITSMENSIFHIFHHCGTSVDTLFSYKLINRRTPTGKKFIKNDDIYLDTKLKLVIQLY